jgi:uncharacterized membrane protein YuzA (DUF378 family)
MKNALYSISFILTCTGSILWGVIAVGGFVGKNFNVLAILSKGNSTFEYILYGIFGISGLIYVWFSK